MRLRLNLRGDLAKLSDVELAERLAAAWQAYDAVERPTRFALWLAMMWRGPIRHPRAYRFLSLIGNTGDAYFWYAIPWPYC